MKKNSGYTFIEVVVAIAILSLIGVATWSGITHTLKAYMKIQKQSVLNTSILQIDRSLRLWLSRIQIPYWIMEPEVTILNDSAEIGYLDGKKEKKLFFKYEAPNLIISTDEEKHLFSNIDSLIIDKLMNEDDTVIGIDIKISLNNSEHSIQARFNTYPISYHRD